MRRLIEALVLLGLLAGVVVADEDLGQGTYTGWAVVDRWGGLFLCTRTRVHYVSKDLAAQWRPFKNRFVTVEVTRSTHGPKALSWRIDAVRDIKPVVPDTPARLTVGLAVEKKTQQETRNTVLTASLAHPGGKRAGIRLTDLTLVIIRKDAPGEDMPHREMHLKISDGPSYLFDRPMSLRDALTKHVYNPKRRYSAEELEVSSPGPLKWSLRFTHMFPPGKYEAWLVHRTDADPGSKSANIAFEIFKDEAEAAVLHKPHELVKEATVHKSRDGGYRFTCDCALVYRRADGTAETWLFEKGTRVYAHEPACTRIMPYVDAYEKAGKPLSRAVSAASYTAFRRKGNTVTETPVSDASVSLVIDQAFADYWKKKDWRRP